MNEVNTVERPVMQRNAQLEELSDKIRNGEPVGFLEAIAVINYQGHLRAELEAEREALRSKTFLGRLLRWFRAVFAIKYIAANAMNARAGAEPGE